MGRLETKVFVISWGWGQGEKGDRSRSPTELGVKLHVINF